MPICQYANIDTHFHRLISLTETEGHELVKSDVILKLAFMLGWTDGGAMCHGANRLDMVDGRFDRTVEFGSVRTPHVEN
jgi:hypothetical protein